MVHCSGAETVFALWLLHGLRTAFNLTIFELHSRVLYTCAFLYSFAVCALVLSCQLRCVYLYSSADSVSLCPGLLPWELESASADIADQVDGSPSPVAKI
ncbi:unnamed protein product [Prorocentrum cordatum]|uniref:Uncharacterized protein n=1 Tax=Prorocentrum cordatum TaxID=2364126 RepID=A0ABN9WSW4_9DINO|nr:unnamed protein product [Polarella glacialis]